MGKIAYFLIFRGVSRLREERERKKNIGKKGIAIFNSLLDRERENYKIIDIYAKLVVKVVVTLRKIRIFRQVSKDPRKRI